MKRVIYQQLKGQVEVPWICEKCGKVHVSYEKWRKHIQSHKEEK